MGLLVGQSAGWQIKTVTYWSVDRSLRLVGPVGNRHRAQHLGPHLGLHSSGAGPRWGTPRASPQPPGAPGGDITVKPEVFLTPPRPRATVPVTQHVHVAAPRDGARSPAGAGPIAVVPGQPPAPRAIRARAERLQHGVLFAASVPGNRACMRCRASKRATAVNQKNQSCERRVA